MNLQQFQELSGGDSIVIPDAAHQAQNIKHKFLKQVAKKNLEGLSQTTAHHQGKEYIVFLKTFGPVDKVAFSFHISSFGSQDLAIETRIFALCVSSQMKNRAKGFLGIVGNVAKGFMSSKGRAWNDEVNLFKHMGQAMTGSGEQKLSEEARMESYKIYQSLLSALEQSL